MAGTIIVAVFSHLKAWQQKNPSWHWYHPTPSTIFSHFIELSSVQFNFVLVGIVSMKPILAYSDIPTKNRGAQCVSLSDHTAGMLHWSKIRRTELRMSWLAL